MLSKIYIIFEIILSATLNQIKTNINTSHLHSIDETTDQFCELSNFSAAEQLYAAVISYRLILVKQRYILVHSYLSV